jgi:hypothetical protein
MAHRRTLLVVALLGIASLFPPVGKAQKWEIGAIGGFGFYHNVTIQSPTGEGKLGFGPRFIVGGFLGQPLTKHFRGEFRYTFQDGDLAVVSGPLEANLDGDAHSFHYDLLFAWDSFKPALAPFFEVGGGTKLYRGTQAEPASQPLRDLARLVRAKDLRPLAIVGAGLRWKVRPRMNLRFEFQDFATPFPARLIVPAQGARVNGWIHDFVPTLGISFDR